MAIRMLRCRGLARDDARYSTWLTTPVNSLGAGFPDSDGLESQQTPPDFYEWATEVEDYLRGLYQGERDQPPEGNTAGDHDHRQGSEDTLCLMEDRYRNGRRRIRDSRTPRRTGRSGDAREPPRRRQPHGQVRPSDAAGGARSNRGSAGPRHRTEQCNRTSRSEPASSSRDPAPSGLTLTPAVPGFPNVTQPMSSDRAVHLWRCLLFDREHFGSSLTGNSRVPSSFLPRSMLQEISSVHETMTEQNRLVYVCSYHGAPVPDGRALPNLGRSGRSGENGSEQHRGSDPGRGG